MVWLKLSFIIFDHFLKITGSEWLKLQRDCTRNAWFISDGADALCVCCYEGDNVLAPLKSAHNEPSWPTSPSLSKPPVLPPSFSHFLSSSLHPSICLLPCLLLPRLFVCSVLSTIAVLLKGRGWKKEQLPLIPFDTVAFIYLLIFASNIWNNNTPLREWRRWQLTCLKPALQAGKASSHLQAIPIKMDGSGSEYKCRNDMHTIKY